MTGDPRSGPVAVAASVAHAALGLPHALDLASRHMTVYDLPARFPSTPPLNSWAKWVFMRDRNGEEFRPVHVGGMVVDLDFSPDRTMLAALEYWGKEVETLSLVDLCTEQLLSRTPVHGQSAAFSPDGASVLVDHLLVDAASGEAFRLPLSGARAVAWWPARSASSLAFLADENDKPPTLLAFDLDTCTVEALCVLQLPHPGHNAVHSLALSSDGAWALCDTGSPAPPGFAFGAGGRVSLVEIATGRIEWVAAGFFEVEGIAIEREHRRVAWVETGLGGKVSVHESLLREPADDLPLPDVERRDRVAEELCQFVDYAESAPERGQGRDLRREIDWAREEIDQLV
jgi:hypothetical protein